MQMRNLSLILICRSKHLDTLFLVVPVLQSSLVVLLGSSSSSSFIFYIFLKPEAKMQNSN